MKTIKTRISVSPKLPTIVLLVVVLVLFNVMTGLLQINAADSKIITTVTATITPPIAGAYQNYSVSVDGTEKYTGEIWRWFEGGDAAKPGNVMESEDKFKSGHTYVVEVEITPDDGFLFADELSNLVVNGISARHSYTNTETGAVGCRIAFRIDSEGNTTLILPTPSNTSNIKPTESVQNTSPVATAQLPSPANGSKIITAATVTITQPAVGAKPNYAASLDDTGKYTAEVWRWFEGGDASSPGDEMERTDKFKSGHTYVAEVELIPINEFYFADNPCDVIINGIIARHSYTNTETGAAGFRVAFSIDSTSNVNPITNPVSSLQNQGANCDSLIWIITGIVLVTIIIAGILVFIFIRNKKKQSLN